MQPLKYQRILSGMMIAVSLLAACAPAVVDAPTIIPPTATLVPPTLTAVPSTATPPPPTATPPLPTATAVPPTNTPAPTPMLASSAKDIVGTWLGLGTDGLYQRFNQDGTCQTGLAQGSVDVECTWRFDGTRLVMTEVKAIGLPPCSSKTGTYEVQLLPNGNIKFVRISDSCAPRARSTAQEHKRIR